MKGLRQVSCCVARGCSGSLLSFLSSKICCRPWLCRLSFTKYVVPVPVNCHVFFSWSVSQSPSCLSAGQWQTKKAHDTKLQRGRALPISTAQKGDLMVILTNRQKPEASNANSFFQNVFMYLLNSTLYWKPVQRKDAAQRANTRLAHNCC